MIKLRRYSSTAEPALRGGAGAIPAAGFPSVRQHTQIADLSASGGAGDPAQQQREGATSRAAPIIQPRRLAAPSDAAKTASREDLPTQAGGDAGFFIPRAESMVPWAVAIWLIFLAVAVSAAILW